MAPAGANRGQCVEDRRVRVQDLRLHLVDYSIKAAAQVAHNHQLANPRQFGSNAGGHWGSENLPSVDPLSLRAGRIMLAARQQYGLPAQGSLMVDDTKRAINITALQRQRMIENMEDPHCPDRLLIVSACHHTQARMS